MDELERRAKQAKVPGQVGDFVSLFLLRPDVPVEAFGQRGEPVGDRVGRAGVNVTKLSYFTKSIFLAGFVSQGFSIRTPWFG